MEICQFIYHQRTQKFHHFTEKMEEEHQSAIVAMGIGITVFCIVIILAPTILFTIKRMTNEIQLYAAEALEKQKVSHKTKFKI